LWMRARTDGKEKGERGWMGGFMGWDP